MIIPCVLMMFTAACGRDISVDKIGITEYYKSLEGVQMQVGISADFPERVSKYRVKYTYSKSDTSAIEILEPESVSGIRISIAGGESEIVFDGARLETGAISQSGTTPLSALPCLMKKWAEGEVSQVQAVSHDGADALLMIYSDEDLEYRTWFEVSTYDPIYAEIISDGRCVMRCEFETVSH